jgi:L-ascorbate 6-phosphate lactonase
MIKPVQSGAALLRDIATTTLQSGEIALWWLGQSGYAIKTASVTVWVDLYLSEHLTQKYANTAVPHIRMTEAPLRPTDITDAQWIFASHKHSDHLDPGTLPDLFRASPDAKLILPSAIVEHAAALGLDKARLIPTRGDEIFTMGALTVHSVPSAHPGLDHSEATGYPFLGFVFEVDGVRLYHSGDTIMYDGLVDRLQQLAPDILLLPINGTDEQRKAWNIAPNFNPQEAAHVAAAVGKSLTIPHHYDMFTFNTVDVGEFEQAAQQHHIPYQILQAGEKFIWRKP